MKITIAFSALTLLSGLVAALPMVAARDGLDQVLTTSSDPVTVVNKRAVSDSSLDQVVTAVGDPVASGGSTVTNTTISARAICLNCDNDGGGGGGGAGGTPPPKHNPNSAWLYWKQDWSFDNGVPVGGTSEITLWSDGYVDFKTHFHDSGAPDYDYHLSCALRDQAGHVYTLTRSDSVHGWFGSRDSDMDDMRYNAAIKNNWNLIQSSPKMYCKASAKWDVVALLNDLYNLIKQIGPIVGAIIAIF
jgi:hypothetical protein